MRRGQSDLNALRAALFLATALPAAAAPVGGVVTGTSNGQPVSITTAGSTTTVTTNNAKTLIDWGAFNISNGETVNFQMTAGKNSIVVNRQTAGGMSSIYGGLNSTYGAGATPGGNVWIINPNGVYFGSTAVVDVGGLLAAAANLSSDSGFLTSAVDAPVSFTSNGTWQSIYTDSGADIRVRDGAAAFIADTVYASGTVHGGGNNPNNTQVIYGSAKDFTLRFSAAAPDPLAATDLHLFDFTVDRGTITDPGGIMHNATASTTAGQVIFLAHADQTAGVPRSFIEMRSGSVTATGNRGDGYNVLFLGGDNLVGGAPAGNALDATSIDQVNLYHMATADPAPVITSAGGVYLRGGNINFMGVSSTTLGSVTTPISPSDPSVTFTVTGPVRFVADHTLDLRNISGITPNLTSGGVISVMNQTAPITVGSIDAVLGVKLETPQSVTVGQVANAGSFGIEAGGSVNVGTITSTGDVNVHAAADITLAALTGLSLNASAGVSPTYGQSPGTPWMVIQSAPPPGQPNAALNITGPVNVAGGTASLQATGQLTAGSVTAMSLATTSGGNTTTGALTSQAPATLQSSGNLTTGAISAYQITATAAGTVTTGALNAPNVSVTGGGDVTFAGATGTTLTVRAGNNGTANPNATLAVTGPVNTTGTTTFTTNGTFRNTAPISVLVATGGTGGTYIPGLIITAADVDITGAISTRQSGGNVSFVIYPAATPTGAAPGDVAIGDNLPAGSATFGLSNAELQLIGTQYLQILARQNAGGAGRNVRIGDASIDSSRINRLAIGTNTASTVPASISVLGTLAGIGRPDLAIGVLTSDLPSRVVITGAIGTDTQPFGAVAINSTGNIVLGSSAFDTALQNAESAGTTFNADAYAQDFGGMVPGHVFVSAASLALRADGKIVQQNTNTTQGGGIGSPTSFGTVEISGRTNPTPQSVQLYGVVANGQGAAAQGTSAASSGGVRVIDAQGNPVVNPAYSFNGCTIGSTAPCTGAAGLSNEAATRPATATVITSSPTAPAEIALIATTGDVAASTPASDPQPSSDTAASDAGTSQTSSQSASSKKSGPAVIVALPSTGFREPGRPQEVQNETSGAANEDLWSKGVR